jgi:hypothetical protein
MRACVLIFQCFISEGVSAGVETCLETEAVKEKR